MALDLAEVELQIDALERCIATGQLQVSYGDKSVRYRDLAEMQKTLAWLESKREQLGGTERTGARQIRMVTRDGF